MWKQHELAMFREQDSQIGAHPHSSLKVFFNPFLAHKLKMFTGPLRMGSPEYSLAVLV